MKVSLVVADGPNRGRSISIREPAFSIGRDPGCQVRAGNDAISRRHCEILVGEEDVLIRDLNSTNGTYVNGEAIRNAVEVLRHGDRIEVGPLHFLVRIVASAAEEATKFLAADGTFVEGSPEPLSTQESVESNEAVGEAASAPTRVELPADFVGPRTARSRPNQPPPSSDEGVSKIANDLIKKLLAKPPRRPPGDR